MLFIRQVTVAMYLLRLLIISWQRIYYNMCIMCTILHKPESFSESSLVELELGDKFCYLGNVLSTNMARIWSD